MTMMLRRLLLAMFVAAAASPAVAQEDLPIGGISTLSGGATDWGVATQRGIQLAIDEINEAGGLKIGGKIYKPRLIMYDDQYSGQGGATAATRLVNADKVKFIVGPLATAAILGMLPITTPSKVLALTSGFSPKVLSPDRPYNYRMALTTKEFAPPMVAWLKKTFPTAKKVAIIGPTDATGQQVVQILTEAYKAGGFDVAFVEKFERGTADFAPLLTRMMVQGVDILDLDSNVPADSGLLMKQARQLGFTGQIVQLGGPSIEENVAIAGVHAENFISLDFFDPTTDAGQAFLTAYRKKYTGTMSPWAPLVYNATKIIFEAMRRADSLEVDAVKAQFTKMEDYATLFGPVKWGGKETYGIDHQLMINFLIKQVKNGKAEIVARVSAN